MKLTRVPKGITNQERFIFYASKVRAISSELELIGTKWSPCLTKMQNHINKVGVEKFGSADFGVTCLRAGGDQCESCVSNKNVYREKRVLKAQFSKALLSLRTYGPVDGPVCEKDGKSFADLMPAPDWDDSLGADEEDAGLWK